MTLNFEIRGRGGGGLFRKYTSMLQLRIQNSVGEGGLETPMKFLTA